MAMIDRRTDREKKEDLVRKTRADLKFKLKMAGRHIGESAKAKGTAISTKIKEKSPEVKAAAKSALWAGIEFAKAQINKEIKRQTRTTRRRAGRKSKRR